MIDIGVALTGVVWLIEVMWIAVLYVQANQPDSDDHE
jgi:hypothetical protein